MGAPTQMPDSPGAVARWMLSDREPLVRGSPSLDGDTALQRNAQLMMCTPGYGLCVSGYCRCGPGFRTCGPRHFSHGSERMTGLKN